MMQKKQSRQNVDLFGTFLKKPPASKYSSATQSARHESLQTGVEPSADADPASTILNYLRENGVSVLGEMLSALGGNTKLYLDSIEQLEGFDLVTRDKNDHGQPTIRLN